MIQKNKSRFVDFHLQNFVSPVGSETKNVSATMMLSAYQFCSENYLSTFHGDTSVFDPEVAGDLQDDKDYAIYENSLNETPVSIHLD